MPDVFTKDKRSEVMACIRASGNKATEQALITLFRAYGLTGWRRRQRVFGKPDFVFRKQRVAVFVDGCFWHCCPKHSNLPSNNRQFWEEKFLANRQRDRLVNKTLREQGWRVLRIWEHDLTKRNLRNCANRIAKALAKVSSRTED